MKIQFAQFQSIHVSADDAEFFSLFSTHLPVHSGLDFLYRGLDAFGKIRGHIKRFVAFQQLGRNSRSSFAKDIRKHIIQLNIGNGQAVLGAVLFPCGVICQFPVIAHQVPELPNISRRDKTAGYQIVFEDVGDPLGIFLVRFLPTNCFDILRVGQNNGTGSLQNVVNGDPIFPCGFHTHIPAMIFCQPSSAPPQIVGECGKTLALVSSNAVIIRCGNTSHYKGFVNIHPAADRVNNFEHNTSPENDI